jgi:CMP-N,N'-diacetyllegionaminic acid synthase
MNKILAVIPARGGSKGVFRKNVKNIAGKPLIQWTIEAALESKYIDEIIVSTEDEEIAQISANLGAKVPFLRPPDLARDNSKTIDVINHLLVKLELEYNKYFDIILILQPTSPLRTSKHIDQAISFFLLDKSADSLVSCVKVPHIFHPESLMKLSSNNYLESYIVNSNPPFRRQDKSELYARNGAAIYLTRREKISEFIFGGNLICFEMDEVDSIDIDTLEDFNNAENLLRARF